MRASIAAWILLALASTSFASSDNIRALKSVAIVSCSARDFKVGVRRGDGPDGTILNVQPLVDKVYEEAARQLPGAGVKIADSSAVKAAGDAASGETARKDEQAAKADAKAKEVEAQMANMPPQVAAMMKGGMMGGGNPMAMMMKNKMKASDDAANPQAYSGQAGGFSEVLRDAAKSPRIELPSSDQFSRKSGDPQAVKLFAALDAAGADGWVILKPQFEMVGKNKVGAKISAQFFDASGKKLASRAGDAKAEIKSAEKGKATADEITAAFQEAITKATEDLAKILSK